MLKRTTLLLVPLVLVAVAVAQDTETPSELVTKLGHDDYAVREAATKKLIDLGQTAVPELEKALKSDDLEVRLRAGRALRAIRGIDESKRAEKDGAGKKDDPLRGTDRGRVVATQLQIGNGKVRLKVTRLVDGKRVTKEYEGKSTEELRQKYPELRDVLGQVGVRMRRDDWRFDIDKFWKDWGKEFDRDFWKNWQKELEREAERMRRFSEQWRKQWDKERGAWWPHLDRSAVRGKLGAVATRPSRVLDAQLELRGRGLVIETIEQGSLASALGVQRYDILLEINQIPVQRHEDVARALKDYQQGNTVTAKVMRRATELTLTTKR